MPAGSQPPPRPFPRWQSAADDPAGPMKLYDPDSPLPPTPANNEVKDMPLRSTLLGVLLGLLWLSIGLAALGWLLTLAAPFVAAAPAPRPKAKARPSLIGHWTMTQHGTAWHVTFYRGGFYACRRADLGVGCWRWDADGFQQRAAPYQWWEGWYVGEWKLEGDTLTLRERHVAEAVREVEDAYAMAAYKIALRPGTLTGVYGWGGGLPDLDFSLAPRVR